MIFCAILSHGKHTHSLNFEVNDILSRYVLKIVTLRLAALQYLFKNVFKDFGRI